MSRSLRQTVILLREMKVHPLPGDPAESANHPSEIKVQTLQRETNLPVEVRVQLLLRGPTESANLPEKIKVPSLPEDPADHQEKLIFLWKKLI